MSDFHSLETYANASGTGINFGESNNNSIAKLKVLLAEKIRYKELSSVMEKNEVKRSRIMINLAFGR